MTKSPAYNYNSGLKDKSSHIQGSNTHALCFACPGPHKDKPVPVVPRPKIDPEKEKAAAESEEHTKMILIAVGSGVGLIILIVLFVMCLCKYCKPKNEYYNEKYDESNALNFSEH